MNARITIVSALACLLVTAAPAQALYLMTPLHGSADKPSANVGDTITITLEPEPENETAKADWAGKTVTVHYSYDASDPSNETTDVPYRRVLIDDALLLDEGAHATFTWTVPAEVDDKNVDILVESAAGDLLAVIPIAVGDAPPQIMAMNGPGGEVVEETPLTSEDGGDLPAESGSDAKSAVPAPGIVALLALAGVAALVLRRRA